MRGIDFIHLGQGDLDDADMKAIRAANIRVGISTHDDAELERALALSPDYVALGPIYPTKLKAMAFAPQGLDKIGLWKRRIGALPLVAIGGLSVSGRSSASPPGPTAPPSSPTSRSTPTRTRAPGMDRGDAARVMEKLPIALTVAGSDSGAGAGVQADLRTFAAFGVYGASAITAITAQNTAGVRLVHPTPPNVLSAQIEAVLQDFNVRAIKIGMLAEAANVKALVQALLKDALAHSHDGRPLSAPFVVLDPVLAASTGQTLGRRPARSARCATGCCRASTA